jgi:hypothetical protein
MDEYKRRTAKYEAMNPIAPPIRKSRTARRNLAISTEFAHSAAHLQVPKVQNDRGETVKV